MKLGAEYEVRLAAVCCSEDEAGDCESFLLLFTTVTTLHVTASCSSVPYTDLFPSSSLFVFLFTALPFLDATASSSSLPLSPFSSLLLEQERDVTGEVLSEMIRRGSI